MTPDQVLCAAWTGALARNLKVEAALSPSAQERLKQRIMASLSANQSASQTQSHVPDAPTARSVRRDEGWVNLAKRVQVKVLHDDGHTLSWLLKLLPGGRLTEHDHADGAEECMILEGQLRINGEDFFAGDYQIALPGSVHHEVASESGSLVYLRSPSSRRKDLAGA